MDFDRHDLLHLNRVACARFGGFIVVFQMQQLPVHSENKAFRHSFHVYC
jgi:hypothetical protein